ncbi:VOC family protein, partial [Mycobacterium sp.]|uniref:VOC family protein n=1 Tax=Mycobacterium sp. TaxID=1785 RepID=UPI00127DD89B
MSFSGQSPVQIAWVTPRLGATEEALSALLGVKTWIRLPNVHFGPESCTYRGRPADFVVDIALSYAGETQLELIAPVSGESIYTEFLRDCGPGLHHICVETDDIEAAVTEAAAGGEVVQRGTMPGGMDFAY